MELESMVLFPVRRQEPPTLPRDWHERLKRLRRDQGRTFPEIVDDETGEPLWIPKQQPEIPYDRGPVRDYSARPRYQ